MSDRTTGPLNQPTGPQDQPTGPQDQPTGAQDQPTGPLNQPGGTKDQPGGTQGQPGAAAAAPADAQPSSGRHEEVGRLGEGARSDVFEVFRQEKDGDPMRHAGNVVAPDIGLAVDYAREFYSRRQESVRLWVVPRAQITDLSDPDLLQPPLDRTFKKPGGYVMRDKLEVAKQRAAGEKAASEKDEESTTGGPDR